MSRAFAALAIITKPHAVQTVTIRPFNTADGRERLGVYAQSTNEFVGLVSIIYEEAVRRVLSSQVLNCQLVSIFDNRG